MKTSEKTNELCKAMSEFQSKLVTLAKDTKAYQYKYTTLASIWESFRPLLVELGLFIFQDVVTTTEGVKVATRITHISDQWIETDYILIPMGKRDAHSTGSACTYGRRYSLSCALGIVCDDDDDGKAAQKAAPKAIPECTPEEFTAFMEKWSEDYDKNTLMEYVQKRSTAYKMSPHQTVNVLVKDETGFVKEIYKWLEKNRTNSE